jgi:small-conductance mechanosensitive channel
MTDQMPQEMVPTVANPGNTFESTSEPTPAPAPAPISPETVVSEPQEETPAPDSSILSTKIDKMLTREESIDQRRSQEEEYTRMQEELRILRTMQGPEFQKRYNEVTKRVESADDDQSNLMKDLQSELRQMREQQDLLQTQLQQKDQETEASELSEEVSTWVKGNEEHFPLINEIGQQQLVFQKMWNTKQQTGHMISETQAARDVETELSGIVERCAPLLGFIKSEQRAERDDAISTTTSGLSMSEPVDRDKMSDEDHLEYLIRQHQG